MGTVKPSFFFLQRLIQAQVSAYTSSGSLTSINCASSKKSGSSILEWSSSGPMSLRRDSSLQSRKKKKEDVGIMFIYR